eukprot:5517500-Lingulodinium_polyedra.AAC.1
MALRRSRRGCPTCACWRNQACRRSRAHAAAPAKARGPLRGPAGRRRPGDTAAPSVVAGLPLARVEVREDGLGRLGGLEADGGLLTSEPEPS